MTLEVQFDPATVGNFSGQLTVGSTASNNTVPLSGVGASHEVDLSWIAPSGSSDPVVGYNIYRAPSGTASFQQVNTNVETGTAYTDMTVQSGLAYEYAVTSVDANGIESVPSNTTTVSVP
jgi:fibronectin type 3 domain-containing protein